MTPDDKPKVKISFFVDCIPVAQPRQRHTIINDRVHNYTPKGHPVQTFKSLVCFAAKRAYHGPLLEGPLRVSLLFLLPRPKRLIWKTKPMPRRWGTCKVDKDNLEKAFNDSLNGVIWVDDSQICDGCVQKKYAAGSESPGVIVYIETLEESECL